MRFYIPICLWVLKLRLVQWWHQDRSHLCWLRIRLTRSFVSRARWALVHELSLALQLQCVSWLESSCYWSVLRQFLQGQFQYKVCSVCYISVRRHAYNCTYSSMKVAGPWRSMHSTKTKVPKYWILPYFFPFYSSFTKLRQAEAIV